MKLNFKVVLFLILISLPALADPDYTFPGGPLQAFGCGSGNPAQGTVCSNQNFFGQTLNDRPVQANVTAQLIAGKVDPEYSGSSATARITINRITDPTDFYHADRSEPIKVVAYVCSYHRSCNWSTQTATLTMERTYGQRYFENGASVDFTLSGNGGAEETQVLASIDIWLPNQQYPIQVKFSTH